MNGQITFEQIKDIIGELYIEKKVNEKALIRQIQQLKEEKTSADNVVNDKKRV